MEFEIESSRGAVAQSVTGCGFDPYSRRWNIYLNLYFHFFALVSRQSAALSPATQHAMPPEIGRKWGTECLNTSLPLPTLLCAGYSVKLIYFMEFIIWNWNINKNILLIYQLHAVSRTQQGRQREPSVKTPNSGGIACWVAELNAALFLDTRAKKWKYKFK